MFFARTTDLVHRLQISRRELTLESAIAKLDRYDLLILDDIAYVTKDQAETSVLFELIAARYERRSMLITANQPFGEWGKIFPDQAMTLAAIDRLVHHATILEMNVESYRRRAALDRKRGVAGQPYTRHSRKPTYCLIEDCSPGIGHWFSVRGRCFLVVKSCAALAAHLDPFRNGSPLAARADAVKVGRRCDRATHSNIARPRLDGGEHAAMLRAAGLASRLPSAICSSPGSL